MVLLFGSARWANAIPPAAKYFLVDSDGSGQRSAAESLGELVPKAPQIEQLGQHDPMVPAHLPPWSLRSVTWS